MLFLLSIICWSYINIFHLEVAYKSYGLNKGIYKSIQKNVNANI